MYYFRTLIHLFYELLIKVKTSMRNRFVPNCRYIEIELTTKCNLLCYNCDRSCRQAPSNDSLSLKQLEHFLHESLAQGWKWKKIMLMGGEPTLHNQFKEIMKIFEDYKTQNPKCIIGVCTNGFGSAVLTNVSLIPDVFITRNTKKEDIKNKFLSFNEAPVDKIEIKSQKSVGCYTTELCGLGFSKSGFYPCGVGAGIDRVFGFDIGIKNLSEVNPNALEKQMDILCQYCGYALTPHYYQYKYGRRKTPLPISETWKKAYADYENEVPRLTPY